MDNFIECPKCGERVEVPGDASDYDWNSGTSFGGVAIVGCPWCGDEITVEATAEIIYVEVLHD